MNEPKTWTATEVRQLIERTLKEYRRDCSLHTRTYTTHEAAELIWFALDDAGLIEYTP